MERRFAAILAADVVGYSHLMEADEAGTRAAFKTHRKKLIEPKTTENHECVVEVMADSTSMELGRVMGALLITVISLSSWTRADWLHTGANRFGRPAVERGSQSGLCHRRVERGHVYAALGL